MKETIVFRPDDGTETLTFKQICVMREVSKILGGRRDRVDYKQVAERTNMSWNGVSYAVDKLVRLGFLGRADGKLYVIKKFVIG